MTATELPDLQPRTDRVQTLLEATLHLCWYAYEEVTDHHLDAAFHLLRAACDEAGRLGKPKRRAKVAGRLVPLLKLAARRIGKAHLPAEGRALRPLVKLARDEAKALLDALRPKSE